jgi:hypothetical protein
MNKGQAALEFISTYGFAFLVLLIVLGAISYSGLFNFATLRSDDCTFPQGIDCMDYVLNSVAPSSVVGSPGAINPIADPNTQAPYYRVIAYNSYGANLTVTSIEAQVDKLGPGVTVRCALFPAGTNDWVRATNKTIWCPIPPANYHPDQRYDAIITLNFTQQGSTMAYRYSTKGTISTTAQ